MSKQVEEIRNDGWVSVLPVLLFGIAFVSFAFVIASHYYFGKEFASIVLIITGVIWIVIALIVGVIFIAYKFLGLGGKLINEHQKVDDAGEADRTLATLNGVAGLVQSSAAVSMAQARNGRTEVDLHNLAWKVANGVNREADRLAQQRQKALPAQDSAFLMQLFGDVEMSLVEDTTDE